jgi:glucokinase
VAKTKSSFSLLVGDIGGTNTRLRLTDAIGRRTFAEQVFPSREFASFEDIARPFLANADAPHPKVATIGIAGPVSGGVARVTNLPWTLDERALAKHLKIEPFVLKNDLVVVARGCLVVRGVELVTLTERAPSPKGKNCAVVAAGTGLGEARLLWHEDRHLVFGSEGGHTAFAAQSPLEVELWQFLRARFPDHVSWERVLSGDGLGALYDFFTRGAREPASVRKRLLEGDRNAAICELGITQAYKPAARAVDLFASLYGAEAANVALRELALGGIFLTGNIARSIVPARKAIFLESFVRKGRFASLMREVPVAVVTDPFVGVRGALAFAKDILQGGD